MTRGAAYRPNRANRRRAVATIYYSRTDGWHDDVSDGSVTAHVTYQGRELKVAPAWVVVAPPNYAPQQKSVRTMWDLLTDLHITAGSLPCQARP
jgi:hypothetical protein